MLATILQDLRFALRMWARRPAFAAMAILTLALGIGATVAVFSVVEGVLLRPLPYRHPERLVAMAEASGSGGTARITPRVSLNQVERWRRGSQTLEAIGSFVFTRLPVYARGEASNRVAAAVDPELLPTLGVRLERGQNFSGSGSAHADNSALLSHAFWEEAYQGAPAVGTTIAVNGDAYTVRGILPAGFQFPRADASYYAEPPDLLLPVANIADGWGRDTEQWFGVARLKAGVSAAAAEAELDTIEQHAGGTAPAARVELRGLQAATTQAVRPGLMVTLALSLVLLLIACVNAMNLHFARGAARGGEMAIRRAVGAGRGRLVRQLLTETALLALVAGLAGVGLAQALVAGLVRMWPSHLPASGTIGVDGRVLGYALAVAAVAAVIAGLAPAVRLGRERGLAQAAGQRGRDPGWARIQKGLMAGQVGLGVALLAAAALLAHSLQRLGAVPAGFRTADVLGFEVSIPRATPQDRQQAVAERDATVATAARMLAAARRLPGVEQAAWVTNLPPATRTGIFAPFTLPAQAAGAKPMFANLQPISGGFFATVGMTLLRGRDFSAADATHTAPVAIVSETMARRFLGNADPVGRKIATIWDDPAQPRTIVGMVADAHDRGLAVAPYPTIYLPYRQAGLAYGAIAMRTALPATAVFPEMQGWLRREAPEVAASNFTTLTARLDATMEEPRFYTVMAGVCAGLAILFVGLGLYGVISFEVSQRRREIAVRMALGAGRGRIVRSVAGDGLGVGLAGAVLGTVLAWATTQVLASQLFELSPRDPVTLGAAAALGLAVALGASSVPAWRASRMEPLAALRQD